MEYFDLPAGKTILVSQKALIVNNGKLLVLKTSQWELPGGLVELEEDLDSALVREVFEETGLNIEVKNPYLTWTHWYKGFIFRDSRRLDVKMIEIAYLTNLIYGEVRLSEEHKDFKWASKAELMKLDIAPYAKLIIEKYINNTK